MRVGILVFDGMTLLDAVGPAEVFQLANTAGGAYRAELVSAAGGDIRSTAGITVAGTVPVADAGAFDTVLVAGGPGLVSAPVDPDVLAAAKALAGAPRRVASVCTGAFILAELGYLDERRATTHWRHAQTLARRYPRVRVEPDVIHVRDGRFLTSAGISAGIDLALALVEEDLGANVAREVARELVVFMQRPGGQAQFSTALSASLVGAEVLRGAMEAALADPAGAHSVETLAASANVSVRHLNRLFRADVGTTPGRWLEQVRLDAARTLLLDGHSVTAAAQRSGFGSDETLRRAFDRHLGITPTAFRERFGSTRS